MARPVLRTESGARIGVGVFPKILWDKPQVRLQVSYVYRVESRRQWCLVLVDGTRDWLNEEAVMVDPSQELLLKSIHRNERPDLRSSCDNQMQVAAHKQRGLMSEDAYLTGIQEQQDSDAILRDRLRRQGSDEFLALTDGSEGHRTTTRSPSLFNLARWLANRLRDRKSKGERVRRLVMNSDSYMDLLGVSRRFVPVATVDAMVFEGLPISIDESYSFRELGFNG